MKITCHFRLWHASKCSLDIVKQHSKSWSMFHRAYKKEKYSMNWRKSSWSHKCLLHFEGNVLFFQLQLLLLGTYSITGVETALTIAPMSWNRRLSELKEATDGLNMREPETVVSKSFKYWGPKATYQTLSLGKTHIRIAYREDRHLLIVCKSENCAVFPVGFQEKHVSQNWEVREFLGWLYDPKEVLFLCIFCR